MHASSLLSEAASVAQLELMTKRTACVATLLSWIPEKKGGKALEVLMCALAGKWPHKHRSRVEINWELCKVTCHVVPDQSALDAGRHTDTV